jgi:hypothetical protein
MGSSVNDFESTFQSSLQVTPVEFVRLVDGHLRVLVSMEQQKWRIVSFDVKNRASELG